MLSPKIKIGSLVGCRHYTTSTDLSGRESLRRDLRRLAHYQIKGPGLNLTKPSISIKRNRDRDGRIVSLELHAPGDEQIIQLVYVQGLSCFTEQQCAGLRDRTIGESVADRLHII